MKSLELAKSICACTEVGLALKDKNHPCHKVVMTQQEMIQGDESVRQRPEPWIGNLEKSKVLFISSNPSISDDPDISIREDFPTYGTPEDDSAEFFVNRFNRKAGAPHATFNYEGHANFLYRSNDGKYRGKGNSFDKPIETWQGVYERAKEILGESCDPTENYALTEVVKCKSKAEVGVKKASSNCIDQWMHKVMQISPANLVVVIGAPARDIFAHKLADLGSEFGADSKGYQKLGQSGRALRDIKISDFGGKRRIYIFNWHPTSMIPNKSELLQMRNAYGPELVNWMHQIAIGEVELPGSPEALESIVKDKTENPINLRNGE
jgi:hypothetical protein